MLARRRVRVSVDPLDQADQREPSMTSYMNEQRAREFKVAVYGVTGAGKTTLCVSAPKPVFLLTERQGFESVRTAAKRRGVPVPPVFLIQTAESMRVALRALRSPDPMKALCSGLISDQSDAKRVWELQPYERPESVVVDGITEAIKVIADDIDATAPPRPGKDGLPVKSERYWSVLGERGEQLIRAFRDLPYHVIFTALEDDRETGDGDEKTRTIGPAFPMRRFAGALGQAVNIVGRMRIAERTVPDGTGKPQIQLSRYIQLAGPSWVMTKGFEPLCDYERPDLSSWFDRLDGAIDTTDASTIAMEATTGSEKEIEHV